MVVGTAAQRKSATPRWRYSGDEPIPILLSNQVGGAERVRPLHGMGFVYMPLLMHELAHEGAQPSLVVHAESA
ncbi:hypothetical protein GCM10022247_36000 [Allokutzneria multivorans]|uniref:Uncharacterized protein n=1 Tax=Allokutzneria multivorans TaxID=1142134 RepID=A0ABP7SEM4_9PSEU